MDYQLNLISLSLIDSKPSLTVKTVNTSTSRQLTNLTLRRPMQPKTAEAQAAQAIMPASAATQTVATTFSPIVEVPRARKFSMTVPQFDQSSYLGRIKTFQA